MDRREILTVLCSCQLLLFWIGDRFVNCKPGYSGKELWLIHSSSIHVLLKNQVCFALDSCMKYIGSSGSVWLFIIRILVWFFHAGFWWFPTSGWNSLAQLVGLVHLCFIYITCWCIQSMWNALLLLSVCCENETSVLLKSNLSRIINYSTFSR
jgi:hypothetical protein